MKNFIVSSARILETGGTKIRYKRKAEPMWISRKEYNRLRDQATNNLSNSIAYEALMDKLKSSEVVRNHFYVAMRNEVWEKISNNLNELNTKIKELESDRDFYKYKYFIEKDKNSERRTECESN